MTIQSLLVEPRTEQLKQRTYTVEIYLILMAANASLKKNIEFSVREYICSVLFMICDFLENGNQFETVHDLR